MFRSGVYTVLSRASAAKTRRRRVPLHPRCITSCARTYLSGFSCMKPCVHDFRKNHFEIRAPDADRRIGYLCNLLPYPQSCLVGRRSAVQSTEVRELYKYKSWCISALCGGQSNAAPPHGPDGTGRSRCAVPCTGGRGAPHPHDARAEGLHAGTAEPVTRDRHRQLSTAQCAASRISPAEYALGVCRSYPRLPASGSEGAPPHGHTVTPRKANGKL